MSGTLHAFEYWLMQYRRTWHGSVFSSFVMPVLFLVGIGYGVGGYVDSSAGLGGVGYAEYVASGLLASTALQIAAGEMTWPVFAALRWGQQYKAMRATPLTPRQMLAGHLLYGLMRILVACVVFWGVMGVFGVLTEPTAPLALVSAFAVGFAIIGWIYAFSVSVKNEVALSIIQRFGIVPVTLFSGVFFPLTQLPEAVRPVAWISPVWHGAELSRWASLAVEPVLSPLWHAFYLLLLGAAGWWVAEIRLRRRLRDGG